MKILLILLMLIPNLFFGEVYILKCMLLDETENDNEELPKKAPYFQSDLLGNMDYFDLDIHILLKLDTDKITLTWINEDTFEKENDYYFGEGWKQYYIDAEENNMYYVFHGVLEDTIDGKITKEFFEEKINKYNLIFTSEYKYQNGVTRYIQRRGCGIIQPLIK